LVGARKVQWTAVALWIAGIACYHLCAQFAPAWGAALPSLALTFVLARLTARS
jgi:NCS1 family nucleobase:cation symporter-1